MSKRADVDRTFATMKPLLDNVARLVMDAPISARDRAGLAAMCAAHVLGVAAAAMTKAEPRLASATLPEVARAVADHMVAIVERGGSLSS